MASIEPLSQTNNKKSKIDQILDKYAKINSNFQNEFRNNLDSTMKAFRKELDSNLYKRTACKAQRDGRPQAGDDKGIQKE